MASGALVAATLAEAPTQGLPPGGAAMLASAFDIGFHVAQCLLRPPDLEQRIPALDQGSDADDLFAELVDEVQVTTGYMQPLTACNHYLQLITLLLIMQVHMTTGLPT